MFEKNPWKVLDKTSKGTVDSRTPSATPIGRHVHRKAIFATISLLTIVILGTVIGNFGSSITIAKADSVEGIGVGIYWDQACTNRTLSLDWGFVEAGSNNTLTVYIRNEGNTEVSLGLRTSGWTPSASAGFMSLNWNYSGQLLGVEQVIPLEITLTVNPTLSGIGVFSFVTIITATSGS